MLSTSQFPSICPKCRRPTNPSSPFCTCGFDLWYGSKKTMRGHCIYCGEWSKLTDEHVLPNWLSKQYPNRYRTFKHTLTRPQLGGKVFVERTTEKNTDVFTSKVRNVCEPCNNGWMSYLTNQAKPYVKALADGEWLFLTPEEKIILSNWVIMVCINLEFYGGNSLTPAFQRSQLKDVIENKKNEVPDGWLISIGGKPNIKDTGSTYYRPISIPNVYADLEDTFSDYPLYFKSTYFIIEHAIFHSYSSKSIPTVNHVLDSIKMPSLPTRIIHPIADYWEIQKYTFLKKQDMDNVQDSLKKNMGEWIKYLSIQPQWKLIKT